MKLSQIIRHAASSIKQEPFVELNAFSVEAMSREPYQQALDLVKENFNTSPRSLTEPDHLKKNWRDYEPEEPPSLEELPEDPVRASVGISQRLRQASTATPDAVVKAELVRGPYQQALDQISAIAATGSNALKTTLGIIKTTRDTDNLMGIYHAAIRLSSRHRGWHKVALAANSKYKSLVGKAVPRL